MKELILRRLRERGDLPALPDIVLRLQKMIHDPSANAKDIARLIELEPVLAGKLLKIANSAYYARSATPIRTLPVAITKIGLNVLLKLVYSLKLGTLFNDATVLSSRQFWRHSMAIAVFTEALSRRVRATREQQDIAYLAGLMHDVGIMVFGYLIPDDYVAFLATVHECKEPLEVQEMRVFGMDHAMLGSQFISIWWNVDERVAAAVRSHHHPIPEPVADHCCEQMVHVANGICNNQGITNGINCYTEVFETAAWEALGLTADEVDGILGDVAISLEQAEELLYL